MNFQVKFNISIKLSFDNLANIYLILNYLSTYLSVSVCLYLSTDKVQTIIFQTFFVWAFKIVIDSRKFTMLLLYILWDDRQILMNSTSNQQLQQELEYTLLKPDFHSWWISKIQSDTLEERYAIKFCFKLGKNATETYGMFQTAFGASCMNWASLFGWHKRFRVRVTMLRF